MKGESIMKGFTLSPNLLLGTATAATQIEGGDTNCNWYHWSLRGKIKNNENSLMGSGHYERLEKDIELMKTLHQDTYRMSIEWSRIAPAKGQWSKEGIEFYIHELTLLKEAGIIPLVTLLHFSCPQWVEEEGAWLNPKTITYFIEFVEKVIVTCGHLITDYCTINEPNVFVNSTYMEGTFPGGRNGDTGAYFKASKHLILAHLHAYKAIHRIRSEQQFKGETKVGFAHHLTVLETGSKNPLTVMSKNLMDYAFHGLFFKGMVEGKLTFPLGHSYPLGKGTYCDFFGINYYSRHMIHSSWNPSSLFGKLGIYDGLPSESYNDLGWEIYPHGLGQVIEDTYKKYPMPIYITENGICDATDEKRSLFIYTHLKQLQKVMDRGIPVERYYHWSLMDNFEWHEGYEPEFGLIHIDYESMERHVRPSGYFYGEICENKAITDDMLLRHFSQEGDVHHVK